MTHLSRAIEAVARALCIAAGDDPDQLTYAHEMKCTGCNREPMHRWRYWTTFSEAGIRKPSRMKGRGFPKSEPKHSATRPIVRKSDGDTNHV